MDDFKIRADLKDVEGEIVRLLSIGKEFVGFDKRWVHLKHQEDWDKVYGIEDFETRRAIERVYEQGRTMCGFFCETLSGLNSDYETYPNLTSIVTRFDDTWVYNDVTSILESAKSSHDGLDISIWAFGQMIGLFETQIRLANVIGQTLSGLQDSDLYRSENGMSVKKHDANINIENVTNSNIAVHSKGTDQSVVAGNKVFSELIDAIQSSDIDDKESLIDCAQRMQSDYESGSLTESYKEFLALAANHMTVVAPFLPALSALL